MTGLWVCLTEALAFIFLAATQNQLGDTYFLKTSGCQMIADQSLVLHDRGLKSFDLTLSHIQNVRQVNAFTG